MFAAAERLAAHPSGTDKIQDRNLVMSIRKKTPSLTAQVGSVVFGFSRVLIVSVLWFWHTFTQICACTHSLSYQHFSGLSFLTS